MDRPGRIESAALLLGLLVAASPARLGLGLIARGATFDGSVYLLAAILVWLVPYLLVRRIPGPRRLIRSGLNRLTGRLGTLGSRGDER